MQAILFATLFLPLTFLLAALPPRGPVLPEDPNGEIHSLRLFLEREEQTCVYGRNQETVCEGQRRLLNEIVEPLKAAFAFYDIKATRPFDSWDFKTWNAEEKNAWEERISNISDENLCKALELAYIFSVWQVSVLEPTTPVQSMRDILVKEMTEEIRSDQRRAAWPFRYLHFLDKKVFPAACSELKTETELRWDFIFKTKPMRKPLGFAVGMCGRPMNAHYIDDLPDHQLQKMNWK